MSKEDMIRARELIKEKRYDEARAVLRATSHHQAEAWLAKLDEIDPPAPEPEPEPDPWDALEATLIEKSPPAEDTQPVADTPDWIADSAEIPPSVTSTPAPPPAAPPTQKEEREIPLPLAIGCIGVVLLLGVCVIGGVLAYNSLQEFVNNLPSAAPLPASGQDRGSFVGTTPINYGQSASGVLDNFNSHEETYIFQAVAGEQVRITMRSDTADCYLYLYTADGDYLTEDDDSGGGQTGFDAQIIYTIPTDGHYVVVANQLFEAEDGPYTLTLEQQ